MNPCDEDDLLVGVDTESAKGDDEIRVVFASMDDSRGSETGEGRCPQFRKMHINIVCNVVYLCRSDPLHVFDMRDV